MLYRSQKVVTIGIAGGTASGKSTIANAILERVGAENITHLLHDSYYKSLSQFAERGETEAINFDHPDSLDTDLLVQHIEALQQWQDVEVPIYDFVRYDRSEETHLAAARPIVMVEGILVLAISALRKQFDIKIFVDTPSDVRFIRRLKRDIAERGRTMENVIDQYMNSVRPMHQAFVEPSKLYADLIIPQGGHNTVAIDIVADTVRAYISKIGYA